MSENVNNQKMTNSESTEIKNDIKVNEEVVKPMNNNKSLIRENMITTAVSFLVNPRVINSPLSQKKTFLMKKGLSLEEIDLSIERAMALQQNQSQAQTSQTFAPKNVNNNDNFMSPAMVPPMPQPMPSFLMRSTHFVSSVALFSGFIYGAYVFYKRYIEPLLFADKEPKKHPFVTIQEQLNELSNAMTLLQTNISTIESNIKKQIEDEILAVKRPQEVSLVELKTELTSIKALLLSKRQFAPTPIPSIPLWQMDSNRDDSNRDDSNKDDSNRDDSNKTNKHNIDSNERMNGFISSSDFTEEYHNSSSDLNSNNEVNNVTTNGIIDANEDLQD